MPVYINVSLNNNCSPNILSQLSGPENYSVDKSVNIERLNSWLAYESIMRIVNFVQFKSLYKDHFQYHQGFD